LSASRHDSNLGGLHLLAALQNFSLTSHADKLKPGFYLTLY